MQYTGKLDLIPSYYRGLVGLVLCCFMLCGAAVQATSQPADELIKPSDEHRRASLLIGEQLRYRHYLNKPLNDEASSKVFEKYFSVLDNAKYYLLKSDVKAFEKYRYVLDDALRRGDLWPAFDIFNRYHQRLTERLEFVIGEIDKGLDGLKFSEDDEIEINRDDAQWPKDAQTLDELWRKRLKSDVLGMKLNGKSLAEIQDVLHKRYTNRLNRTKQTNSEDAFQIYINAFTATFDPHTQYFSPSTSKNFNINMSLSLEGIGAVLRNVDEYTSVVRLVPAGPAHKAGSIKPSDRIVSVGQGETGSLVDVVGWRLDDVVELIRGPKGSVVKLEIIPADADLSASKVIQITRNTVKLEEQAAKKKILNLSRGEHAYKLGVIEIPAFYIDFQALQDGDKNYKSSTRDVRQLISELKQENIDGLIVDLRNNGGGSLQEADSLTGLFIKSGPTVQVKAARFRADVYADTDDEIAWDGPLVVMVNRLSASASEIFAGAIQDYGRGLIIGGQTYGKGTVQTLVPLNHGQLKITSAKFYRISGKGTQNRGVVPDIVFPDIYDLDEIGESALEDAMPWDVIRPVKYQSDNSIEPVLDELLARHTRRAANDSDFVYLRALSELNKRNSSKTHLSLREDRRRDEKKNEEETRLKIENSLRTAKGEKLLKSLSELEKEVLAEEEQPSTKDEKPDALVTESGNILLDYISLRHRIAQVSP